MINCWCKCINFQLEHVHEEFIKVSSTNLVGSPVSYFGLVVMVIKVMVAILIMIILAIMVTSRTLPKQHWQAMG